MEGSLLKLLRVALLGPPNAGKSTLLNKLVCNEISCVSNKVHTTRRNILGVYTENQSQLEFYDAPGIIDRQHSLKHRIEDSVLRGPDDAALKCDLLAIMVDISNEREQRRLNKGLLNLLHENAGKPSILILNKVDLLKEKRKLLDISYTLTEGCIGGRPTRGRFDPSDKFNSMSPSKPDQRLEELIVRSKKLHKFVIDLNQEKNSQPLQDESSENNMEPKELGYKNFSQVFSISALQDDGVEELRKHMISLAKPVEKWPHGPDFLTNQSGKEIAHGIIRGRMMDHVDKAIPYMLEYNYYQFQYDDVGSLHIHLCIKCPEFYMISKVIGEKGSVISRVSAEAREAIANALGTDVKLIIQVDKQSEFKFKKLQ